MSTLPSLFPSKQQQKQKQHAIALSLACVVIIISMLKNNVGAFVAPSNSNLFITSRTLPPQHGKTQTIIFPPIYNNEAYTQRKYMKWSRIQMNNDNDSYNGSSDNSINGKTESDDDDDKDKNKNNDNNSGNDNEDAITPLVYVSPMSSSTSSTRNPYANRSNVSANKRNNGKYNQGPPKRKMDLMWCSKEYCKDSVRERVVGDHNQIILDGPATGQVAYRWSDEENNNPQDDTTSSRTNNAVSSVLILVKPNDDELMRIAANVVSKLTGSSSSSTSSSQQQSNNNRNNNIQVLLVPDLAAKLKHYHGVDDERIALFEAPQEPGFGQHLMQIEEEELLDDAFSDRYSVFPDLVCTLGGDGLLMHASMVFQGPVPPIISIAGGSLGFLTPFSTDEMVDAIRIALGAVQKKNYSNNNGSTSALATMTSSNNEYYYNNGYNQQQELDVFPPNMPSYPYEPLMPPPHYSKNNNYNNNNKQNFSSFFGYGDRICLSIRMRLDVRIVNREGRVRARFNVLNEVTVDRGSSPYLAALECFCDDVHLTTVQADGVIFATPTGSTAYSMAAGGSVVHPAVPCILVTPICPHVLSFRSMIFPDHVVLRCYVPEDARTYASVAFDGKHRKELQRGDSVQIQMSPYPVPTINRFDHSSDWLESLKRSFNFNTRPRQRPL